MLLNENDEWRKRLPLLLQITDELSKNEYVSMFALF